MRKTLSNSPATMGLVCCVTALTLMLGQNGVFAQSHSGGGSGGAGGSHVEGAGHDGGHAGASGKRLRRGGDALRGGGGHGSLRDVFRQLEGEAAIEELRGQRAGQAAADRGQRGGGSEPHDAAAEAEVPSKPSWAGGAGGKPERPDYGDLYIVIRDENGVPILVTPVDADGNELTYDHDEDPDTPEVPFPDDKQVYYVDSNGDLQCCLPYTVDAEGDLELDTALGEPSEAVFSRTSVVRSPDRVTDTQYYEFVTMLNSDDVVNVTLDDTDRLVFNMTDGTTSSVDSPLVYLTLYSQILTTGTLEEATDRSGNVQIEPDLDKLPPELAALADPDYTIDDLALSAKFLAFAMDKSGTATADMIVYLNAIMDVATEDNYVSADYSDYVKYEDFTYDREATYSGETITVQVLISTDPDVYETRTVDIYETVFANDNVTPDDGIDAFTQAVDDARAVVDYVHNYAPPEG